ncbi:MAG: long-chain fatty acid--CoA ligase [Actinobacteria bacterium]|nr:long-chain fatty acid--CoA ligase [Actinomycetota bacterium]
MFRNAEQRPSTAAYHQKVNGTYVPTSWSGYADQVRTAGKALMALGFRPGQHVTILGFNRPEWVIVDLACMAVGGAPAGIYTTNSADEVGYINQHSEAPLVLVENESQLDKVLATRERTPALQWIVTMRGMDHHPDPAVLTWDDFLAKADGVGDADFAARLDGLRPGDLATLIYTSGTTGPPKGVMLSHSNLTWTSDQGIGMSGVTREERVISYLPLSHIAEQMFTLHIAISVGYTVYFAESIPALAGNLKEVRPTLFFAVPRVWEKFQSGVTAELAHATGAKAKIAAWAQNAMRTAVHATNDGRKPPALVALQARLADTLVGHKVRTAVGLDECRFAVSGAAPISQEVLEFFGGFGLSIMEVYGQSEGSGPSTFNQPGRTRFGSVGPPFPGTDIEIAGDGEVMVRGGNVFMGYYENPEATAETLRDGWLVSGDLGALDEDGYLYITGRKKDIIVTSGGKNIAPKNLEAGLKDHPLIGEAVVIGDRRHYLTALVCLDPDAAAAWAKTIGVTGPLHEAPEVNAEISGAVDRVNQQYARAEQIKKFRILPRELTIEDGELTGTLKVKRNVVTEHFSVEIESMYA